MFPSFENVCGGVSLANSSHITSLVSSLETTREIVSGDDDEMGASNILKKSKTAFGICFELFTIYGNITLRRDRNSGGTVSFKGARSVKKIFDILQVPSPPVVCVCFFFLYFFLIFFVTRCEGITWYTIRQELS